MPAMPKDKATAAVSLSESNFSDRGGKIIPPSSQGSCNFLERRSNKVVVNTCNGGNDGGSCNKMQINGGGGGSSNNTDYNNGSSNKKVMIMKNSHQQQQNLNSQTSLAMATSSSSSSSSTTSTSTSSSSAIASTIANKNMNSNNYNNAYALPNNNTMNSGGITTTTATTNTSSSTITPPKKSPKDFIFGKYIGEGSFSIVYLAVDVNTKREYAIKVCEKRHILREHKQEYIRREREVMHMMTNVPGFVNLSCTFQDVRSLYFVMTYAKNGDLLPYINKVGSFDVDCTRHYAAEIVLACEQMHRRNIVHRDLKPENILLDEDMHTLIADFGSAKILTPEDRAAAAACAAAAAAGGRHRSRGRSGGDNNDDDSSFIDDDVDDVDVDDVNDDDDDDEGNDTGSDDVDSPSRRRARYHRRRKGSFVGTAQYVSPEVLQNGPITPSADLWALGCIIYQMISGLPPFRGSNDYAIFKEILSCDLEFPQGFDKDAEDLVRRLLKVKPEQRLGAHDMNGRYESIRAHPFFAGINFDTVRQRTPPPIYPYLPGVSKDQDFRSHYRVPDNLEPGLDDKQLTRLLGVELGTAVEGCGGNYTSAGEDGGVGDCGGDGGGGGVGESSSSSNCSNEPNCEEIEKKTITENIFDLTDAEKQKRLEQQKSDKWHIFADNEVILKKGYVNKRKGLFARKRMLLLTTGPRLIYIDPVQMIKKGEIPWSPELRVEPKNFKIFFVHTPNRTYYLEDPEGYSLVWVDAMEKMRELTYVQHRQQQHALKNSTTYTTATSTPAAATATTIAASTVTATTAARTRTTCATTHHMMKSAAAAAATSGATTTTSSN